MTDTVNAASVSLGVDVSPSGLRNLAYRELPAVAAQIRRFLVGKVSATGGHLGPNLGVVELTIALHRVFDSPTDTLIFDTGHQAYVHKVITGRADNFDTLRQTNGLSGYPSRAESPHDAVENSHASTAISYADGLTKARQLTGQQHRRVVAIVGDGAMGGGMSWEALNDVGGAAERPIVIVLNDNGRSYLPTVGGLAAFLHRQRSAASREYRNLFNDIGITYLGPVDGHDVEAIERELHEAVRLSRPVVVHVITTKGKGYTPAEADDAERMHTVGAIDPVDGQPLTPAAHTWTDVFGEEMAVLAAERFDVVGVAAAMLEQVGLGPMASAFPTRVFDVGIAEQHAVTSAAGLALGGLHPVVALYATFLNRAFDQLLMDVALHRLPVTFVLDRAGVTGTDGPSHNGMWDASILPVVPGLRVACPRDPAQLRSLLRESLRVDGPTVVRYPKSVAGQTITSVQHLEYCDILHADPNPEILLLAIGPLAEECLAAARRLNAAGAAVTVADPRWIAPLDPALVEFAASHRHVLTVEDTTMVGSLGTRLALALGKTSTRIHTVALPSEFLPQGTRRQILQDSGLDEDGITTAAMILLNRLVTAPFGAATSATTQTRRRVRTAGRNHWGVQHG